jgi:hypothetical protein
LIRNNIFTTPIEKNQFFCKKNNFSNKLLGIWGTSLACPQPGQAGTKKKLACPGNYKFQIPNYKQIPNPKSQNTKQKKLRKKMSVNILY